MLRTIIEDKITWYDITKTEAGDLEFLKSKFDFHPVILDELLHPSARSRVETYDHYLFLVYHLPIYNVQERTSRRAEIDFLITKNHIITVHYEKVEPLVQFEKTLKNNAHLYDRIVKNTTGHLLYYLLEETVEFSMRQLRHMEEKVKEVGSELFTGKERNLLEKVSYLKRDLLDFRIIIRSQRSMIESLIVAGQFFWGERLKVYFSDLLGDYLKISHLIENLKETVESFETTNAQLLNAKSNYIMQRFTVLAFLTFPLMLLVALFDIDAVSRPIIGKPYDFWIIFGAVALIILIMIAYFKKKEWL
ncbi:MAG: CorA family divalent cation transporter [Patescibacteria group bacterium]